MKVIARKQEKRKAQGKETNFRFRGKVIKSSNINRWRKRSGMKAVLIDGIIEANSRAYSRSLLQSETDSHLVKATPSTPSDISYSMVASPSMNTASPNII